ncbi:MAG: integration host factor subunit beta [Muribaculaceae bacterium]|nr:integration host factor subunit beta [Muribaculaceae bacterium]
MKKNDLVKELAVSEKLTLTTATKAVDGVIRVIKETLAKGEDITLRGFGTLSVVDCAEKTARNISTGQPVIIPAHKSVKFKPSKELKESLNNGSLV